MVADERVCDNRLSKRQTSQDQSFEIRLHQLGAIALTGDSAGGNLALATAVRARDAGLPRPGELMLMSPALDFTGESESYRTIADAPLLTPQLMAPFTNVYVGNGDPRSPLVTPFDSDLSQLPPALIHVGSWELLRDDSITIAKRLHDAGSMAELKIWEGMCHSWQLFAPMLDDGMASIEQAASFAQTHLHA